MNSVPLQKNLWLFVDYFVGFLNLKCTTAANMKLESEMLALNKFTGLIAHANLLVAK